MPPNLSEQLAEFVSQIDRWTEAKLAGLPSLTAEPMQHAMVGGKKLRGFLVCQSCSLYGIPRDAVMPAAGAIEAMHAFSLVHDDLPAMDDDDLRRGRPTVHKAFDEAAAILAGDALQSLSFEWLSDLDGFDPAAIVQLSRGLAQSAGAAGMVLGQAQDIAAESAPLPLTIEDITELQANKTGALIEWSVSVGPILAGTDQSALRSYARHLGLAFQIWDDVLDIEGDAVMMGKAVKKDADAGKATFVSLLGLDDAKKLARQNIEAAKHALSNFGQDAATLCQIADFVISRDN